VGVHAHTITVEGKASTFKALSADAGSLDGLNIHGAVVDELHAHKTRAVFDVLSSATGSRKQPLIWLITTAGYNRSGVCYEQRGIVCKILERVQADETYFGIIYTLDEGDDPFCESSWKKSNPNYGVSVEVKDIAVASTRASMSAGLQNEYLTKRNNVWCNADVSWMNMQAWDACKDQSLTEEQFIGQLCIDGLDLASKVDVAARLRLFHRDGHFYAFGKYYLPEAAVESGINTNAAHYSGWARAGLLTLTPGEIIDFDYIKQDILTDKSKYQIEHIGYDPYQATYLSTQLTADGAHMVEYGATVSNFSEPMKELEALVLSCHFHHNGDPVLAWMISNVVAHLDAKDNIFPRKERPENKIDGAVALIMALGLWMRMRPKDTPYYEQHGLLVL
jgi:phage terminase large subunit-like protein